MSVNPLETVRDTIYDILATEITGITINKYWPYEGVGPPSITLSQVSGVTSEIGLGRVASSDKQGVEVYIRLQIDIYQNTKQDAEILADRVIEAITKNLTALKLRNIYDPKMILCVDGAVEGLTRVARKVLDFTFRIEMRW